MIARIAIVGPPAAGKTTLARELCRSRELPFRDLDDIYWLPSWRRPAADEWRDIYMGVLAEDRWVVAGNYQSLLSERLVRAELVIILDPGILTCLLRLGRRSTMRVLGRRSAFPAQVDARFSRAALAGNTHLIAIARRYRQSSLPKTVHAAECAGTPMLHLRARNRSRRLEAALAAIAGLESDSEQASFSTARGGRETLHGSRLGHGVDLGGLVALRDWRVLKPPVERPQA